MSIFLIIKLNFLNFKFFLRNSYYTFINKAKKESFEKGRIYMEKEELKNEKVKKEKVFTTKDLVLTAIIACLIGAIITAGGFAIFNKNHKRDDLRDFKQDGIQRSIGPGDNNSNNDKKMRQLPQGTEQNNNQNNSEQAPNTQNPPSDAPNQSTPNNQNNNSSESKT